MARRSPPRKVTYFEPVPPRLARNTIIESTFDVGRRFRCTFDGATIPACWSSFAPAAKRPASSCGSGKASERVSG
jgi:hypothetical protein